VAVAVCVAVAPPPAGGINFDPNLQLGSIQSFFNAEIIFNIF
jgi:hypothetical protein